jgi:hypothetical protein
MIIMAVIKKLFAVLIIIVLTFSIFPILSSPDIINKSSDLDHPEDNSVRKYSDFTESNTRGIRIGKVQSTRIAAEISDGGMEVARAMLERAWTENITEAMVAKAIDDRMVALGSSSVLEAFGVLVISGNDTGVPDGHGDPTDDDVNQILPGEVVIVDIGARYNGYVSDITRTFFMGEPTDLQKEIYQIILDAQDAAISVVKHGIIAGEVDDAARKVITDAGYGEYFTHCVGHGIGFYVHSPTPSLCSDTSILSKARDHIITIEPGIYFEENFGIRTEDDVIVDWLGSEVITFYPKNIEHQIVHPPANDSGLIEPIEKKGFWESEAGQRAMMGLSAGVILAAVLALLYVYNKRKRR